MANNKLREAVVLALSLLDLEEGVPSKTISQKDIDFIKAALAEPVKNYEVGTVGQQDERFTAFCNRHFKAVGLCDKDCPCRDFNMIGGACPIVWAQMPYTEGGAK